MARTGRGGQVEIDIVGNDKPLEDSLKSVKGKAEGALGKIGKVATGTAKAVAAISGATIAAGAAIAKVGMDFETSFAKVQTIMDPTQKSVETLKKEIMELSTETGVAAGDLSESVYNAISATGDTAGSVKIVGDAVKLAQAGFTDTESALGVLTTAINAYGMSAEDAGRISDSLVKTQNLGVTTIEQLSSSMGKAIASASAYGIDLYNVEAAYVAMTKSGISTAESTTYMSSMFKELGDSGSAIGKILKKETGQSFDQLMASGKSLGEVLKVVYDAAGQDGAALMQMWGSAEAGKAANAIINQGLEAFDDNLLAIRESTGTTEEAYATMADTLQHQTEKIVNSVKNLGISIYEDYAGEMAGLVGEAGGWLDELAQAYSEGGISAMGAAAGSIAPKLTQTLMDVAGKAVKGVGAAMPGLIKGLLSAVPGMFKSLTSFVPEIAGTIFDTLSEAVETAIPMIVDMLPELGKALLTGLDSLFKSFAEGAGKLLGGAFNGIEKAMHKGQVQLANGQWVDEEKVKTMTYKLDLEYEETGVTAEDIRKNVETAQTTIEGALEGIEGIDAKSVAEHVIAGDVASAIEAALLNAGVDEGQAKAAAESIKAANETINAAVEELGLTDEQAATLREMTASGATKAEIEAYLTSCGIDQTQASASATTIDTARTTMTTAIAALPEDVSAQIKGIDFTNDKAILETALGALGLDESAIAEVLASYDSVRGQLTAGVAAIFSGISETLTDGKVDTDEDMQGLKESVEQWAAEAYGKIEEWYTAKIKELQESGLTGSELESALADTTAQYNAMKGSVEGVVDESLAFVDSMANKSTAYVQQHMSELEGIKDSAIQIASEIDALTFTLSDKAGKSAFERVRAGDAKSEEVVQIAVAYEVTEYKIDTKKAEDAAAKAREELLNSGLTGEDFTKAEQEIEENLRAAKEGAQRAYENGISEMLLGIADSIGMSEEELTQALKDFDLGRIMEDALAESTLEGDWYHNSDIQTGFKDQIAEFFHIDPTDPEFGSKLIENLRGLEGGIGEPVANALQKGIETGDYSGIDSAWSDLFETLNTSSAAAMEQLETSDFGAHIRNWIENGVFDGIEGLEGENLNFAGVMQWLVSQLNPDGKTDTSLTYGVTAGTEYEGADETSVEKTKEDAQEDIEDQLSDTEPQEYEQDVTVKTDVTVETETVDTEQATSAAESAGTATVSAFASAVAGAAGEAKTAGKTVADSAEDGLGDGESAAKKLGGDFASGYASGIAGGKDKAVNAAVQLVKAAVAAVKDTQNSASPSKVTAGLGRNFGEGYEIGIRESMQNAVATARAMAGEVLNASVIGSGGLGVLRVEAGAEPLQVAMEGADKPVYLDGTKIADIQGGHNAAQLAFLDDRSARGVGR